ncbi:TPA: hypothetical protein DEW49_06095 [bacterium]|uniref:EamA domain-containing protein n=1 Tax=bacterium (Candidatus Ratteibacteria) CG15_BIG_FIL_POST_REV_8_21_14_020_41_12 TaxID=2014291 RepID=A0A2M7GZJ1_9BACT|nr:MAG: hypothetical protein COW28_02090 [bacterium (Candidatus Ratteibacteria) CG15_BIG_FIL_POST_REV_8_21_14_020_41_12]HCG77446.1 hypothetical protein [bacterium]
MTGNCLFWKESLALKKILGLVLIFYSIGFPYSFLLCLKNRIIPVKKGVLIGAGAGISSFFGSLFLLSALKRMAGPIVFPIAIGGNLATVSLLAAFIFKERLRIKGILGIISGIAGIILLSL